MDSGTLISLGASNACKTGPAGPRGATDAHAHTYAHARAQRMASIPTGGERAGVRRAAGAIAPRQDGREGQGRLRRARGPPLIPLPVRGRQEGLLDVRDSPRASVAQKITTTTNSANSPTTNTPDSARCPSRQRCLKTDAKRARSTRVSQCAHRALSSRAAAPGMANSSPGASRSRLDSTGAQRIAELDRAD